MFVIPLTFCDGSAPGRRGSHLSFLFPSLAGPRDFRWFHRHCPSTQSHVQLSLAPLTRHWEVCDKRTAPARPTTSLTFPLSLLQGKGKDGDKEKEEKDKDKDKSKEKEKEENKKRKAKEKGKGKEEKIESPRGSPLRIYVSGKTAPPPSPEPPRKQPDHSGNVLWKVCGS